MNGRPRCSDAARDRGDDPGGTAAPARCWLLVEHAGPWLPDAWPGSGISPAVRAEVDAAVRAAGARIALVRRPGRRLAQATRSWAVLGPGRRTWGDWEHDRDLLAAVPVLSADASPDHAAPADRTLLVCAHGRHDTCCAVRGRPVATALQARWPTQTWECSHLGGCRFAGTLAVPEDGIYYGGLDAGSAVKVVEHHLAGRLSVDHVRGWSSEPPVAQVALLEAHRRFGPAPADGFRSTEVRQRASDLWQVDVAGPAPEGRNRGAPAFTVTVQTAGRPAAHLTCRAAAATRALGYRVLSVQILPRLSRQRGGT